MFVYDKIFPINIPNEILVYRMLEFILKQKQFKLLFFKYIFFLWFLRFMVYVPWRCSECPNKKCLC